MLIVLDSMPLSLLAHPAAQPSAVTWAARLLAAGHRLVIPEIIDYEDRTSAAGLLQSPCESYPLRVLVGPQPLAMRASNRLESTDSRGWLDKRQLSRKGLGSEASISCWTPTSNLPSSAIRKFSSAIIA